MVSICPQTTFFFSFPPLDSCMLDKGILEIISSVCGTSNIAIYCIPLQTENVLLRGKEDGKRGSKKELYCFSFTVSLRRTKSGEL